MDRSNWRAMKRSLTKSQWRHHTPKINTLYDIIKWSDSIQKGISPPFQLSKTEKWVLRKANKRQQQSPKLQLTWQQNKDLDYNTSKFEWSLVKGWREREVDFLAATLLNCKGNKGWANGHMMSNKNCKDHTVIDNNANVHAINKARHARTYTHTAVTLLFRPTIVSLIQNRGL